MLCGQQYLLVCFAFCSIPARSCSEELFHHTTTLSASGAAACAVATSPVNTTEKNLPTAEQKEAGVRKGLTGASLDANAEDENWARRTLTSPKPITAASPSLLTAPAATAAASGGTSDAGRRKGRARSESDNTQRGISWSDSTLPAT